MNNSLLQDTRKYLFILLGFSLPLSIAITNILIVLISFICIVEGDLSEKWNKICSSKWMISLLLLLVLYLLYFLIFGVCTDTFWILKRVSLLLILPILYSTIFSVDTIKKSAFSFLSSMFVSSVVAIAENFEIISINPNWTVSAFMKYTDHNTFLASALILSIYSFFRLKLEGKFKISIQLFIPVYLFSLFSEGGKAGQIVFIVLLIFLFIYLFRTKIKVLFISFLGVFLFSYLVYNNSEMVKTRFDYAIKSYKNIENEKKSSSNTRYILGAETIKLIKQNPVFGYGAGSFTDVFGPINSETEKIVRHKHKTPHNNYLYVWMELGILGLILLLSIFYFQIRELYRLKDGFPRVLLPLMYLIIMFADSYFFSHNTLILYLFLSVITTNYQYKSA
ncbi:MAG: O-antigen ligase family protein [Flavobacteriales bacterium]|nr:O-antigen ligase family protein [Flavobacteriales bacterium]